MANAIASPKSKGAYERACNKLVIGGPGVGENFKSKGGRIPDGCKQLGTWLRRNDSAQFNADYKVWAQ